MSSQFDINTFMQTTQDAVPDKDYHPVAVGTYPAFIEDVIPRSGVDGKNEPYNALDIIWNIQSEEEKERLGKDILRVRQGIFLTPNEHGVLDMKNNQKLGKLLEALGINSGWRPTDLKGMAAIVQVSHRPDKNDSSVVYDEVSKVAAG